MRCRHLAVGALGLVFATSCDSKGESKAEAEGKTQANAAAGADAAGKTAAKVEVAANADADASADANAAVDVAADVKPQIGGTIVVAGDYNVEILAFVGGRIEAVIMDAKGALVVDAGQHELGATLAAKGDARAEVDLKWDVELARFVGQVDAGIELVPGPVEVELTVDGKANVGTMAELGLAAEASHGGQIMVAGAWSLELVAEAGFVHAYVFDASGKAHAAGDLDLDVDVDAASKLDLKWDPPSASYKAKLEGGLELAAKPLVVRVAADGKAAFAAVQSFHASAKLAVNAKLDADAEVRAPTVAAKADAKAQGKASVGGSAKGSAKVETKKSASSKGSVKIGDGIKASGSAKAKAGFKFGS